MQVNARQPSFDQPFDGRGMVDLETVEPGPEHQRHLVEQNGADRAQFALVAEPLSQQHGL